MEQIFEPTSVKVLSKKWKKIHVKRADLVLVGNEQDKWLDYYVYPWILACKNTSSWVNPKTNSAISIHIPLTCVDRSKDTDNWECPVQSTNQIEVFVQFDTKQL